MRSDSARELALVDWLFAEEAAADTAREPYLSEQRENISFYMNHRLQPLPQGLEWMSGELLPDSFLLIESLLPNIATGVFGGKSLAVDAFSLAGTGINKVLDKLLYKLRRDAGFEFSSIPSIRMCGITGHQTQKNVWVDQWGTKRIPVVSNPQFNAQGEKIAPGRIVDYKFEEHKTFSGPKTFYPDNERIWKSLSRDALGEPLIWFEELHMNLDAMKQMDRDYREATGEPFYMHLSELEYGVAGRLARDRSSHGNAGWSPSRHQSATEQMSGLSEVHLEGNNAVRIRHAWVSVPYHIRSYEGEPQQRLVVYTPDGLILRDVPMPTWNMKSPFHDIMFMRLANELYGRSPLKWALPEIEQKSTLRNLRMAEAWLNIFRPMVANRNANFDQHDWINAPGAVWFFDHDTYSPKDVIQEIARSPIFQEVYREDALMEAHINRVMGSTPNMQGEGLGSRATLGEAELVDARAGGRADLISRQLAWQYELPAAKDFLGMFTMFSDRPLQVQVDGEEASFPVTVFSDEIDFEYDVLINAGEYGVFNGMALNGLREVLGLALQHPEALEEVDPRLAISNFQHRTGMDNILRPASEVEMRRRQQMMMAMAQQAQGQGQPMAA